jgi:hypothetical protein
MYHVKGAAELRMADRPYTSYWRAFHPVYPIQGLMSEENCLINILPVDSKQKIGNSCLLKEATSGWSQRQSRSVIG